VEDQLLRGCLTRCNSANFLRMPYDPTLPRDAARQLRTIATEAEQKLWSQLRKRQLYGFQFRRRHSIGPYFVDFVCLDANLLVEVDGSQHALHAEEDESRSILSCVHADIACCDSGTPK
jgi:very-short-patch-repair endonuclease